MIPNFVIGPLKSMLFDKICSFIYLFIFNFWLPLLDIVRRIYTFYDLKSIDKKDSTKHPFQTVTLIESPSNKLLISIRQLAFSCYTSCIGRMPKSLPGGQILSGIYSYLADLYRIHAQFII